LEAKMHQRISNTNQNNKNGTSRNERQAEAYKDHRDSGLTLENVVRFIFLFFLGSAIFMIVNKILNPYFGVSGGHNAAASESLEALQTQLNSLKKHYNTTMFEKLIIQKHQSEAESELDRFKTQYKQMVSKNTKYIQKIDTLKESLDKELLEKGETEEKKQKRIDNLMLSKRKFKRSIKNFSKRLLLEKYGEEPYYVEINLEYDPESNVYDDGTSSATDRVVLKMAPNNDVPHSIYWFLEQVSHKLYDGTSFHRNADEFVQGGPFPNHFGAEDHPGDAEPREKMLQKFKDAGLSQILFQEYSPNFPHAKYTVGYAGRPSGPDFYISMKDNTDLFGPNNKNSPNDDSEGDPCFASVVEGTEAVERMHRSNVIHEGKIKFRMEHNIAIKSMRVIKELA